jgi:hypothetical protein
MSLTSLANMVVLRGVILAGIIQLLASRDCPLLAEQPQDQSKSARSASLTFGKAEPMPEMNALFQPHEGWIGGDGAYSVAIAPRRTLWLFSDTWIGSVRQGKRTNVTMVNNTLGILEGRGKEAKVEFVVRKDAAGKPVAFIAPEDKHGWFWPQAGACSEGRLYLFLAQFEKTRDPGAFGFRQIGRWLGTVDNPGDPPTSWRVAQIKLPCTIIAPQRELAFGAAVLREDEYLYVFGMDEDRKSRGLDRYLVLARAPAAKVDDFAAWRYYREGRWQTEFHTAERLAAGMASECSVSWLPEFKRYVLVYTEAGLSPRILARTAAAPWGPWSAATEIYRCPEAGWDKRIFCYAAKAHPAVSDKSELVVSYVANSFDIRQVVSDARLYWPRFVRVPLHSEYR